MTPQPLDRVLWWCHRIVRLASWIVPRPKRAHWRGQWEAAIWHWSRFLVESGRVSVRTEQELLAHCWGAFSNALWQRFNRVVVLRLVDEVPRAPWFCMVGCASLLAVLLVWQPHAISTALAPLPYAASSRLLHLSLTDTWLEPEVLREAAATWPQQTQAISAYAVYAWRPNRVQGPAGLENVLTARVTPNTFVLLGAQASLGRVFQESDSVECENCVVLSDMAWRTQFHRDERVVGQSLLLNGKTMKVIGVMPFGFRFPAHDIAVYSLFDANSHVPLPRFEWPGAFLRTVQGVAAEAAKPELENVVNRGMPLPSGTKFTIRTLREIERQSLQWWAGILVLALLILIALKSRQLARLRSTGPRAALRDEFRWYAFFWTKAALLLAASLAGSLGLAHLVVMRNDSPNAYAIASLAVIWFFLFGAHLSLTWAIRDQLRRCRVCLRGLGVRVNLGIAGRLLLDLNGVELVCDEGHGALHVPIMESSCVDHERWTYLDQSWRVLLGERETRIQLS